MLPYEVKTMQLILDQTKDAGLETLAHILGDGQRAKLSRALAKTASADPSHYALVKGGDMLFPVTDPLNVLLSYSYLRKQANLLAPNELKAAAAKIASHAKLYGVNLNEAFEKTAIAPAQQNEVFAIQSKRVYPLRTAGEVKAASNYFEKFAGEMEPTDRREYAVNLSRRARELGIKIGAVVEKYASNDKNPSFVSEMKHRIDLANPDMKEAYAAVLGDSEGMGPTMTAYALMDVDKLAGLDVEWEKGVPDPFSTVFGSKKQADEVLATTPYGDITLSGLSKAASNKKLSDLLDGNTMKLLKSHPKETLASLPEPLVNAVAMKLRVA